jgi:L-rhamnose mutarotase
MKRILLVLVLTLTLVSVFAQTQTKNLSLVSTSCKTGTWNEYTQKYNWDETVEALITFTVTSTHIYADDEARSVYKIIRKTSETDASTTWSAIDEKKRSCLIMLSKGLEDIVVMTVGYNNLSFVIQYRIDTRL